MTKRLSTTSLLVLVTTLALAGCQTTGTAGKTAKFSDGTIAGAMASAAKDAAGNGRVEESLQLTEKLYRTDPNKPDYILAYARDLRHSGRIDDAKLVVRTPALAANATEPMLTEAAMVLVADGNYTEAADFAGKAVLKDNNSADAHQALALAYSGMGNHAEAEAEFANALHLWPADRDKTPVINNMAMSQAAQGKIREANSTMALATGEALRSETYQNNRALLASLRDTPPEMTTKMPALKSIGVTQETINAETSLMIKPSKKPGDDTVATTAKVIEAIEPAAGGDSPIEPQGQLRAPANADVQAQGPTPLFEAGDLEKMKYKSMTGFTPHGDGERRLGLNN
jgi:Flp pilus assembly protein TadD